MTARTTARASCGAPFGAGSSAARVSPRMMVASTRSATAVYSPARSVKCR